MLLMPGCRLFQMHQLWLRLGLLLWPCHAFDFRIQRLYLYPSQTAHHDSHQDARCLMSSAALMLVNMACTDSYGSLIFMIAQKPHICFDSTMVYEHKHGSRQTFIPSSQASVCCNHCFGHQVSNGLTV